MLKDALVQYLEERKNNPSKYLVVTERSEKFSANAVAVFFQRLYRRLGFQGVSSHSGRRTFITKAARKISLVGGSLRDVQLLAGHASLNSTQLYVLHDVDAQRKVVQAIY